MASRTSRPAATTSWPTPSAGIAAIRNVRGASMRKLCPVRDPGTSARRDRGAEVGTEQGQGGVRVVPAPEQRVRVDRGGVVQGDAPQVVAVRPEQVDLLADQ